MTESVPAPAVASVKAAKKKSAVKRKGGTSLSELILNAVSESKGRKGVSFYALKKILAGKGYNTDKNKARFKATVLALLAKEALVRVTGVGVSGSFRIGKTKGAKKAPAKKAASKVRKSGAKKPKKPVTKKLKKVAAKSVVKKSKKPAKKPRKTKSPIKKTVARKTKSKSPKKTKPVKKTTKKTKPKKTAQKKK